MPLDWQSVFIPFDAGIDENTHPKLVKLQVPLELENVVFTQEMALSKRNGFTFIDTSYWSPPAGSFLDISFDGPIRELFSTGDELCAVAARRLFALNEEQGIWYDRGPVSPFTGASESVFGGDRTWLSTDCSTDGNYTLYAGQWYRKTSDAEFWAIRLMGRSLDGSKTFPETDILTSSNVGVDRPHGPKCAACGVAGVDKQLLMAVGVDGTAAIQDGDLQIWKYVLSTPHLPPVLQTTITDLWFDNYDSFGSPGFDTDKAYATRAHDIMEVAGGDYIVAWIGRTNNIELRRYDSTHTQKATATIAVGGGNTYRKLALGRNNITLDRFYLLSVNDTNGGTRVVQGRVINTTTLATVTGPTTLHTLAGVNPTTDGAENADHLGVVDNGLDGGADVLWTYSVWIHRGSPTQSPGPVYEQKTFFRTSNASIGNLSSEVAIPNALALAKPFSRLKRFYLPATIGPSQFKMDNAANNVSAAVAAGWHSAVILDLDVNLANEIYNPEDPPFGGALIVGIYHVYVAPSLAFFNNTVFTAANLAQFNMLRCGSLNNVSQLDSQFLYSSARYTYWMPDGVLAFDNQYHTHSLAGTESAAAPRHGADEIRLDFDGPITAARLEAGSAVVGGGAVFFYSGAETMELGFPIAPFIWSEVGYNLLAEGYEINTSIFYQAIYKSYDTRGWLHRSAASPLHARITHGAVDPEYGHTLRANTHPASNKPGVQISLYVTDPANEAVEVIQPLHLLMNRKNDNETGSIADEDRIKGAPIYTLGGYLENVSPEGSAFVQVALNRLLVTGQYSRGRVHYSQKFTPGTAFEDAIAPEMNEGLGKLFPDGERGTGISEMDGQAILFTAKSIYGLAGSGPNPTGQIGDFELQLINGDGGCVNARSVCKFRDGVMFEGTNGIYALLRNHDVVPIGEAVQETLKKYPVISRAVLWEKLQMVIVACHNSAKTDGVLLCYDYIKQRWITWRIAGAVDAFSTTGLSVNSGRVDPHLKPWMRLEAPGGHKSVRYALDDVSINFHENKARGFRQADSGSWGLLLEPSASNLIVEQNLVNWDDAAPLADLTSTTGPDGSTGNYEATDDDAGAAERRVIAAADLPSTAALTVSAWTWRVSGTGTASFRINPPGSDIPVINIAGTDSAWTYRNNTATPGGTTPIQYDFFPAGTGVSDTSVCRLWGMQLEQREHPTSFIGSNGETFVRHADKLNIDFSYVSVDGYYNFAMTYSPHYAQNETAGDHTLFYIDANNKAIFRKSDSKIVWTVNGVALESSTLTFARFAFPSVAFKNGRDERKMILSSFATGNGVVTGAVQGPAPTPAEMVVLGGPSGSEEASALYLFQNNTVPSVPVIALAVHKDILYLATPDGVVLKYDVTTFKDNALGSPQWVTRRVKSSHLQLAQSSWHRCKELVLLMERRTAFDLNVSLYRDFNPAPFQTEVISNAELSTYTDPANKTQPKIKPTRQKGQALQFEISDSDPGGSSSGEGGVWTGVVLRVAPKGGTSKVKKEQRR